MTLPVRVGAEKLAGADLWCKLAADWEALSCHCPLWLAAPHGMRQQLAQAMQQAHQRHIGLVRERQPAQLGDLSQRARQEDGNGRMGSSYILHSLMERD